MSRRVSLADRADAAGIGDATKTSGVVDTLLGETVAAGDHTIVDIPVKFVVPHPRNRKILDDDVADLVASFKAGEPIINPLGVTAAADWNAKKPDDLKEIGPLEFIITAGGHRRLRAAELAGLDTVPCIVRPDFAGAQGRRSALLENLHRKNLDAFEEAEAFAELTSEPYKMSQRDLAAATGYNQSHISKRIKLLKLPSTVREQVRLKKLDIGDALALAGVVDNKPVFDDALEKVTRFRLSGDQAVRAAQSTYDAKVTRQRIAEKLAGEGVRLLDRRPAWYANSKTEPTRLDDLKLDAEKHASEPCHVAYIDDGSIRGEIQAVPVCEKPGRHLKACGDSKLKLRKAVEEQIVRRGRSDADADARRDRREQKKLWPARAAAARAVAFDANLDPLVGAELVTRGVLGNTFDDAGSADTWKALVAIIDVDDLPGYPNEEAREQLQRRYPAIVVQRLVALSFFEARLRSTWKTWGTDGKYYLDLLASRGYVINPIERKKLGGAKPRGIVNRCRICGNDEPPAGVTWVEADLCSACSDAQEAGWVSDDTPIEVPRHYQQVDVEGYIQCLECEHGQPTDGCDCPHCFCNPANVDEPAVAEAVSA